MINGCRIERRSAASCGTFLIHKEFSDLRLSLVKSAAVTEVVSFSGRSDSLRRIVSYVAGFSSELRALRKPSSVHCA